MTRLYHISSEYGIISNVKEYSIAEIGAKMDALGLWDKLLPFNWAIKPNHTALPYFCITLKDDMQPVKVRLLFLEGWQTLHDFLRTRVDRNFGVYSSPTEFPHYELIILANGTCQAFRHDTGYLPIELKDNSERTFFAKLLWQAYGVMLRMETDEKLPLRFFTDQAIFSRIENNKGKWSDEPLNVSPPPPYVEKVSFSKPELQKAKDLPIENDEVWELDFRLTTKYTLSEPRPRSLYSLQAINSATHEKLIDTGVVYDKSRGLKELWMSMPPQIVREIIRLGRLPSEIKLVSGRVFRLLRPLCIELPFKLSMHDSLPNLEKLFH